MNGRRVSSDALAAFVVFSEHLHLTKAAEELRISQPALYSKLATLSRELGCSLYERAGRGLQLTPDGKQVAAFAREHQQRLDEFLDQLHGVPATRPLVIASAHTGYLYLLGPTIHRMLTDRPGSLRPLHTNREQTQHAVRLGHADLGVFTLPVQPTDLATVPIATYPQVLLMPDGHPLAAKPSLRLRDLTGTELIVPPPTRPHRINLERALTDNDVPWTVAVEAEGLPMTINFAELGVGLAVVAGCVQPAPGLTTRPIDDLPPIRFYAIHRPGALSDPRLADLLTQIQADIPAEAQPRTTTAQAELDSNRTNPRNR